MTRVVEVFEEPRQSHHIHLSQDCSGYCPFHTPSRHRMVEWPKHIRETTLVERMCPHGVGHPDPDSVRWMNERTRSSHWGTHGCDGCCLNDSGDLHPHIWVAGEIIGRSEYGWVVGSNCMVCGEARYPSYLTPEDRALMERMGLS